MILLCALTMGLGTAVGGWRIIKTMGVRLTKLEPVHGFARGDGRRPHHPGRGHSRYLLEHHPHHQHRDHGGGGQPPPPAVRWGVAGSIVLAWVLTFPVCGLIAYLTALLLR